MITAVVNFPLAEGTTLDKARELFSGTAPRYQSIEGLVRKYYLFNPETGVGGGCYLFEDRASAEATFSPNGAPSSPTATAPTRTCASSRRRWSSTTASATSPSPRNRARAASFGTAHFAQTRISGRGASHRSSMASSG